MFSVSMPAAPRRSASSPTTRARSRRSARRRRQSAGGRRARGREGPPRRHGGGDRRPRDRARRRSASASPASIAPTTARRCAGSCGASATRRASWSSTTRWSRWRPARPGSPGVVIIAGTGSIAYGRNASERSGPRRRLGLRARRRGQRLLDWPGRAARGAARGRSPRAADRADAAAAEALRRRAGAGSAPRGLSQQPAAVRDRRARAVRRRRRSAKATARRSASFAARRTSSKRRGCPSRGGSSSWASRSRSSSPAASSARCPGCAKSSSADCRWPRPEASRSCSPVSRRPARCALALQEAAGGARRPCLQTRLMSEIVRATIARVTRTSAAAARALARHVADAIRVKPDLVLGLPTGRTPLASTTS